VEGHVARNTFYHRHILSHGRLGTLLPYALMQAALDLEITLDAPQLSLKWRRIFAPFVDGLFIPNKLYSSDFR
jgi:hypothetical protein